MIRRQRYGQGGEAPNNLVSTAVTSRSRAASGNSPESSDGVLSALPCALIYHAQALATQVRSLVPGPPRTRGKARSRASHHDEFRLYRNVIPASQAVHPCHLETVQVPCRCSACVNAFIIQLFSHPFPHRSRSPLFRYKFLRHASAL